MALLECVPNFSEGRDPQIIRHIAQAIERIPQVSLLHIDSGKAANRTVMTFAGAPQAVVEAAFQAIKTAATYIDMSRHTGEHPRIGATDVCPLIPISGISMAETVALAQSLAERVGRVLQIPVYLYEQAAASADRRNLATIRAGEYEGLQTKLADPAWIPDFGPTTLSSRSGATVIGARPFLAAYNVNLQTTSAQIANRIALDVREKGRVRRQGNPVTGPIVKDSTGKPIRIPGSCPAVKAIGWYIEEYALAQVSMNLTDLSKTPLHDAFEACCLSAASHGTQVTGSELVGMIPLQVLLDAGLHFLKKQHRPLQVPTAELIEVAIQGLGLNQLYPFDPRKKILEYRLEDVGLGTVHL